MADKFIFTCNEYDYEGNPIPGTGCGILDYVTFDGSQIADRLLEDVTFEIHKDGKVCTEKDWHKDQYLRGLNQDYWLIKAEALAETIDIATCPICGEDAVVHQQDK